MGSDVEGLGLVLLARLFDRPGATIGGRGAQVIAKVPGRAYGHSHWNVGLQRPQYDPPVIDDPGGDWRSDMHWDRRPSRAIPAADLGAPFDRPIRSALAISIEAFAYRALHGGGSTEASR
jgi:hypothetical protein